MARSKKGAAGEAAVNPVAEELKVSEPVVAAESEQKAEEAAEKKSRARKAVTSKAEKPRAGKTAEKAPAEEVSAVVKKTTGRKAAPVKKEASAKGAVKKAAEVQAAISVQFSGKEYTAEKLVKIAMDVWQYDLGRKPEEFQTVELYVKPEESAVYYVINGDTAGSFAI